MIKYAVLAVALAGCGPDGDDCHRMFDKLAPVVEQASGKKLGEGDKARALAQCYDGIAAHKEAPMRCVLDAIDAAAVQACLVGPLKL